MKWCRQIDTKKRKKSKNKFTYHGNGVSRIRFIDGVTATGDSKEELETKEENILHGERILTLETK